MQAQHIRLKIDLVKGRNRTEPVHALLLINGNFRLLHSPGFVEGVAAGDELSLLGTDGSFQVVCRGGNLAVQLFSEQHIAALLPELQRLATALGGVLDGSIARGAVLSVPLSATFQAVGAALAAFVTQHPECTWSYSNVYAADGETPLGWWEDT